jgi:hypothetical protein
VHKRLCGTTGTTGTAARRARPFTIKKAMRPCAGTS